MPSAPAPKNSSFGGARRIGTAKVREISLVQGPFKGYRNREDITMLPPGLLVTGSQNVLTNTSQRIAKRKGYTVDGQTNTTATNITSAFDWTKLITNDTHMRSYLGNLQVRYNNPVSGIEWVDIYTSLNVDNNLNYATFWDITNITNQLLFVNGDPYIYRWGGGVASFASATANTITNSGSQTWAELGFDIPVNYTQTVTFTPATTVVGTISVLSSNPTFGGTGYAVNDVLTIVGVPGSGAQCVVAAVNAGVVTSVTLTNVGSGYIVADGLATTGGGGTGCTVSILQVNTTINPATITDNTGGFLLAGFALGDTFAVSGTISNNGNYQIDGIDASIITINPSAVLVQETNSANLQSIPIIVIGGINYQYTGGTNTNTITGVSPDPTIPAYAVGTAMTQAVHQFGNGTTIGLPPTGFNNDLIANLDNQIYIASTSSSQIFTSKVNNFLDYSFSAPRLQGEGAMDTINGYPTAFVNQEDNLYVSAGKDNWYRTQFTQTTITTTVGATSTGVAVSIVYETLLYQQLKVTFQQAAQSQSCVTNIPNDIIYLSFEPIINTFGRVDNILLTPQITDISYPIINDMNAYDFTDASIIYFRKFIYISVPKEGLIIIYNMTDPKHPYWEAPQTIPVGRFSIIDDALYGHGYLVPETYELFVGYRDRAYGTVGNTGHGIPMEARFSYENSGVRSYRKDMNAYYVEGYISQNANLTIGILYDIDGCATDTNFTQLGSDIRTVCIPNDDNSLGKFPFGQQPLGINLNQNEPNALPPKFRVIKTFPKVPYYEFQPYFQCGGIDEQVELIAFGGNTAPASQGPVAITE